MKAFCLVALIPLVACNADADAQFTAFTAFGGHASHAVHAAPVAHHAVHAAPVAHHAVHHAAPVAHHAVHHAAPVAHHAVHHAAPVVHHTAHHAVAHHAVAHHAVVHQGYEQPKHNCSVLDVVEIADVCTPALDTVCTPIELSRKSIKDVEQCYTVTRTVCTESTEEIDNEVCTYSHQPKTEATTAKTVEVSFNKECENMMVTVCQPNAGYGYHAYGHNYCKEVAQETCYNVPVLTVVEPAVDVIYPEPIKTCVNKPISLPRISCEDLSEEKCITVPEIEVVSETFEKCVTGLVDPACQAVELTLPKQVCKEINYGYAEDTPAEAEPAYEAPAAPAYAAPAEAKYYKL